MKKIDTLVEDIYSTVDKGAVVSEEDRKTFSEHLSSIIKDRLETTRKGSYLRVSNLGEKCSRRQWFQINKPELGEPLGPTTKMKFLLGDVWEAVLLFLARTAGHTVEGDQDEIDVFGVKGHRDAVIDGTVVDVKSASSRSFMKFQEGLDPEKDDFGYLTQLNTYLTYAEDDPVVTDKDHAAFLVGDKTLGKLTLDVHKKKKVDYEKLVKEKREMLDGEIPPRPYEDIPDGKSGNRKIPMKCSYCEFKFSCWPNLRQYNYSGGPRYLTVVKREPNVDEKHPF